MARCKLCEGMIWTPTARGVELCKACATDARAEIQTRHKQIKKALIRLRYGNQDLDPTEHCRVVEDNARALLRYERLGLKTTTPPPAELVRAARLHRTRRAGAVPPAPGPSTPSLIRRQAEHQVAPRMDRRDTNRRKLEFSVRLDPGGIRGIARDVSSRGVRLSLQGMRTVKGTLALTLYTTAGTLRTRGTVRWIQSTCAGALHRDMNMGIEFLGEHELLGRVATGH